jgi:hypothetical protein
VLAGEVVVMKDIRELAEGILRDDARPDIHPMMKPHEGELELARFALAVLDTLIEWDSIDDREMNDAAHDIRAAIARNMAARK